jgi:glycosyltransferase involved in cell wall biosynthesis/2-polyprenyl-3-methyl-5-hydroxy-6-metoxy-1,4-benzoquinol methylase
MSSPERRKRVSEPPGTARASESRARVEVSGPWSLPRKQIVRIIAPAFFDRAGARRIYGGAERYLAELLRLVSDLGYPAEVFQPADEPGWVRTYEGSRVVGLAAPTGPELEEASHRASPFLPSLTIYLAFYDASSKAPPPAVGISHGVYWDDPACQSDADWHRNRALQAIQSLDAVVSVDTNAINWVRSESFNLAEKLHYIPNFVDLGRFRRPRRKTSSRSRVHILFPRRLVPARGFWLVAEFLPRILEAHPHVLFRFAGEAFGHEKEQITVLCKRYTDQVSWSALEPEEMPSAYRWADIALIPSVSSEGTSLACLEAQAAGCAVVATRVGGLPDIVFDEHNGLLVEPTSEAVQAAVERLIENHRLRQRLGKTAAQTVADFRIERWRERWSEFLATYLPLARPLPAPRAKQRQAEPFAEPPTRRSSGGLLSELGRRLLAHDRVLAKIREEAARREVENGAKILELENQLESEVAERRGSQATVLDLSEQLHRAEAEVRRLHGDLSDQLHHAEAEARRLDSDRNKAVERQRQAEAAAEALRREGDRASSRIEELQQQVDLGRLENSASRENESRLRMQVANLEQQLHGYRLELNSIHHMKWWRFAASYWSLRRKLRLRSGKRAKPLMPLSGSELSTTTAGDRATAGRTSSCGVAPITAENRFDVVCFSMIDWDFRFQRPQQLARQLGIAGHRVFYIATAFRQSGEVYQIRLKAKNVYEVSLRGPALNVFRDSSEESAGEIFASLDRARREIELGATVAVVQLPFWWPVVRRAQSGLGWPVVYDLLDHHAGFSSNAPEMLRHETNLLESADLVVASSSGLQSRGSEHNEHVILLRNACEFAHFARAQSARGERPVIGYYGAIADWFDSDLVADLAVRHPEWDFVLVGSTWSADTSRLSTLDNVRLVGEKPYSEIPEWLAQFDVAIIPFKRTPLTEATNPVKAYEMLAAGKPIVAVPLPELADMAPLLRIASTAAEFEEKIKAALAEQDPKIAEERRAFAMRNTWEARGSSFLEAVREAFPRVSIIVVAYNNLGLNRLCLESIYNRTAWPNFEVIVVDNGSTDGTQDWLREFAEDHRNLRVILNPDNRGFAAANNQGLREATGEYLVLLNNDTVVTRRWLSSLVRHLSADKKIGLLGAVTNAIANKAQVPVGYSRLEDLPVWAAEYVDSHDGEVFEMPMVAMFCVAMRREIYEAVGPLDERFGIGMFEDDDYNRRVSEKGYEIRCARDAFVHHWQKASFRLLGEEAYLRLFEENRRKYAEKWGTWTAEGIDVWQRPDLGFYRDQLAGVVERMKQSRGAVIFLPSVGWGIHLFQRPHHLARTFARRGWIAIFDCSNAQDDVNGFKEVEPNLFLFRGPAELLHELPDPILWTLPYNFDQKDGYPADSRVIYDWIDDLEVFPYDRKALERNHSRALREATIVATVARTLHERALTTRQDALYLPNGVEASRFADLENSLTPADPELAAFVESGKPVAGYYGALAEWFDYELLDAVADFRPDWNFLLIGPMYDESLRGQPILKRPNVLWLGPRPYETLPGYLRLFDVAMIPFQINDITLATSPLKLYEYFAGGKPVVTTPMPECQAFAEVRVASSPEDFAAALDAARDSGRDATFIERLRELGRENSWEERLRQVENPLEKLARLKPFLRAGTSPADRAAPPLSEADVEDEPPLTFSSPNEVELAERFASFRKPDNPRFFGALVRHLASNSSHPFLSTYFEFAITCNERGERVADLLAQRLPLAGKRYLDVGCAYAGFLVAFARRGAEVAGIDIDEQLLGLAAHNLRDQKLEATVLKRDLTRREDVEELSGCFDVITVNDVLEHVADAPIALRHIAEMLQPGGVAYMEIPNPLLPAFVRRDGHYGLFGITLLNPAESERYHKAFFPSDRYGVGEYLALPTYLDLMQQAGLRPEVLSVSCQRADVERIVKEAEELRNDLANLSESVPAEFRSMIASRVDDYVETLLQAPRASASDREDFCLRYGQDFWRIVATRPVSVPEHTRPPSSRPASSGSVGFAGWKSIDGWCNICGRGSRFYFEDEALYRESLVCKHCFTTSRYRSVASGILRAVRELAGVNAQNIAALSNVSSARKLKIYDTQTPFYFERNAYPIPDLLERCQWIDIHTSVFDPSKKLGWKIKRNVTNQNLERLTFRNGMFDIVVTSDVMEHVRLDERAHAEIRRVLKPSGIYLFTVPHFRDRTTLTRVEVRDPEDPSKDVYLTDPEYHGDANSEDGRALSYRSYGVDLDDKLAEVGFSVDYTKEDVPELAIMNTELFYCRLAGIEPTRAAPGKDLENRNGRSETSPPRVRPS